LWNNYFPFVNHIAFTGSYKGVCYSADSLWF